MRFAFRESKNGRPQQRQHENLQGSSPWSCIWFQGDPYQRARSRWTSLSPSISFRESRDHEKVLRIASSPEKKVTEPPLSYQKRSLRHRKRRNRADRSHRKWWRLTNRIFLRRVALITSRSRSSCAHPSALRKEKLHVCEACDDSNPSDEVVPQKIRPSKPLCIDIKPSKEKIREVDYIKVAPRVTRSEPSAEEVPNSRKFQKEADRGHRRTYRED